VNLYSAPSQKRQAVLAMVDHQVGVCSEILDDVQVAPVWSTVPFNQAVGLQLVEGILHGPHGPQFHVPRQTLLAGKAALIVPGVVEQ
jgi:hypothetical protein